ncbi:MAG: EAL domain-containing protein [Butyrivibrio sp.]|nr:EAL domain-containing protein [Butyrivibrio sp.]
MTLHKANMNPENLFGTTSYYDKSSSVEELVKIISCGIQQDEKGVIFLNESGRCVYANKRAFKMFRVIDNLTILYDTFQAWRRSLGVEEGTTSWCRVYKSSDKERLYHVRYKILNDNGKIIGSMYVIHNVSESLDNDQGEQYRLTHDELTRLYNKEGFVTAVKKLLADADPDRSYVIVYSNIKDFKLINQLFGLNKGNDILISVADMLSQMVKEEDVYGRINGDQFALCMPEDRFDEKMFKAAIKERASRLTSRTYSIHVQLGVYKIHDRRMDVSFMCDRAYMACKTIKRDNVCEVAWYNDDMLINALLEKEILSSFDFAIINKQFGIYLQPQHYSDGRIFGAEALARWLHPENGVIEPEVFISVLERADLIYKLDKYIWELAAAQLAKWKGTKWEGLSLSVNVSPKDIYYLDIKKEFDDLVKKYDINPARLNIEITETAVTTDVNKCAKLILDLRKSGFLVEIDDFGSGYSSLNMLKDIKADVLKIDMGFLKRTENHKRARVILNFTIDMAHELGMGVITEGVETNEQLAFLEEMGCEMFQGYYFDMPMPVDEFEAKYKMGKE